MSIVCQQCKEPLQLDASLVDLTPSAYDMIASSLPPHEASPTTSTLSQADKLARLRSPNDVKLTWKRAAQAHAQVHPGSLDRPRSPRAQGKQRATVSPLPNESFVLLQDSVINHIPPSTGGTRMKKSRSANVPPSLGGGAPGTGSVGGGHTGGGSNMMRSAGSDDLEFANPAHNLKSTMRLFNLISSRTDIDHPLCADCTHVLLTTLTRQLEETKRERDGYIAFVKEVRKEKEKERTEGEVLSKEEAERTIEELKAEEKSAVQQLREAEREKEQLEEELKSLQSEEKALEEEEAEFWRSHNQHLLTTSQQTAQLASLRAAYAEGSATLEKLERTNVYNDAFCIGHDGVFGTINGLRLGRTSNVVVEWSEINAAWGQTLLLLYTIARKLDFHFDGYRLIPMGSFSRVERTGGDKASYELYGSGDLHLGRLLHNRRFDFAMVSFLDCLKQLVDHVKTQDPSVDFPHQIVKDKIGEASVKLQFSQEEGWTRALRHVLLALKILLKWTTNGSST